MKRLWTERSLGEVITLKRGYDLPNRDRRPGHVPIVSSSGVTGCHDTAKVKGPGVVTGRYGTLGEVFYINGDFWPLNTSLYVQDFHGSDPRFISYFLRTLPLDNQNAAGAVPGVNRNHLHRMPVRVPDVPTQRKIAAILSAYDDLIENNTRRIEILEEMARSIYREWFVNFRFPGHEKVKMVDSELGPIPEGWDLKSVPEAMYINPGTKVPKETPKPFVSMQNLANDSMLINGFEYRTGNSGSKFRNGDTLFARITPCLENGKTGFVQFLPTDDSVAMGSTEFIVLRSKTLSPEIVYLMSRSGDFRNNAIKSMSGASGRQRVQERCFENYRFAHPPDSLIRSFRELAMPMFGQVQLLALKNANLRHRRDLLLPKLISGEVDASEADTDKGEDGPGGDVNAHILPRRMYI